MAYPVGDDMLWVTFFLCCPQHMLVFSTACICCGAYAVEKSSFTDVVGGGVVLHDAVEAEIGQIGVECLLVDGDGFGRPGGGL